MASASGDPGVGHSDQHVGKDFSDSGRGVVVNVVVGDSGRTVQHDQGHGSYWLLRLGSGVGKLAKLYLVRERGVRLHIRVWRVASTDYRQQWSDDDTRAVPLFYIWRFSLCRPHHPIDRVSSPTQPRNIPVRVSGHLRRFELGPAHHQLWIQLHQQHSVRWQRLYRRDIRIRQFSSGIFR